MTGPYLYDDDPAPLHTGTPRRRHGTLIALLSVTSLLAVGMVAGLFLVKGSPAEQSEEVAGVFLAALAADDTETAHLLLCEDERARIAPDEVAAESLLSGSATVVGAQDDELEGGRVQQVEIEDADGGTARLAVIAENGARVCGITR